jgi:hypothetical protein
VLSLSCVISNLDGQIHVLREEMHELITAAPLVPSEVVWAEVALFSDAGAKMNARLRAAREHYVSAQQWLEHHGRMARAAIWVLEMRLRELG